MVDCYKIVYQGGSGELTEKKSRFLADIKPVKTEDEAFAFVEEIRKKYWDARHHCYAYVIGERGQHTRCSDDGEPSQTAGRPMLDVLQGQNLHDVCAVVTRYFGGTLLGTGGLVRAYSGALKEGLKNCVIVEKRLGVKLQVTIDYNGVGKLQYLAAQEKIEILESQYTDRAVFLFLVPEDRQDQFKEKLTEVSGGRAAIRLLGPVSYGMGDELILF